MTCHKPLPQTESDILRCIIEYWKRDFSGISALELADVFSTPHEEVIRRLRILANGGRIDLRRTRLGQPIRFHEVKTGGEVTIKVPADWKMVDTFVAFPKRYVLEEIFAKEGKDYGVFTNRLHKGDSQIKHYYFAQDVLDNYLKYPDRYHILDDVVGGQILTKNDYYFSVPEDKRDNETFAQIRYGKRRLKGGTIAIAVIVKDLSNLPYKQQQYWASFEINNPQFVEEDEEFGKYWRESFEASFLDHEDPLQQIYETLRDINELIGQKLFRNDSENPYLRYLVVNTNWAYQNAHKELFKLFSPDSLDKDVLLDLLKNRLAVREEELKGDIQPYKGKWDLFKVLIERIPGASFGPLRQCRDARVEDAHKVGKARLPNTDLAQKFRGDCLEILETFKRLELYLKNIL